MKMNFTEFMKYLIATSHWLKEEPVQLFTDFMTEEGLQEQYVSAIAKNYEDDEPDEDGDTKLYINALCAFPSDLVSCFINWSVSTEVDWSAVNVRWQDYINANREPADNS